MKRLKWIVFGVLLVVWMIVVALVLGAKKEPAFEIKNQNPAMEIIEPQAGLFWEYLKKIGIYEVSSISDGMGKITRDKIKKVELIFTSEVQKNYQMKSVVNGEKVVWFSSEYDFDLKEKKLIFKVFVNQRLGDETVGNSRSLLVSNYVAGEIGRLLVPVVNKQSYRYDGQAVFFEVKFER